MRKTKLTKDRQERFLKALAETGNVTRAVEIAATSRTRVYAMRKRSLRFSAAWDEAEEVAADRLEAEAHRRAVEGIQEPLVSGGRIVRDDDGQPIAIRRYSDRLLELLLRAHRPDKFRDQKVIHAGSIRARIETDEALAEARRLLQELASGPPRIARVIDGEAREIGDVSSQDAGARPSFGRGTRH